MLAFGGAAVPDAVGVELGGHVGDEWTDELQGSERGLGEEGHDGCWARDGFEAACSQKDRRRGRAGMGRHGVPRR